MAIQPDHLLTFARVAELGSLSAAATELNLTQPAVSNQLKLLAQAIGEPVFSRHRFGVRLTPAGEGLLPHALAVRRSLAGARAWALELRGLEAGGLSVAASTTNAVHVLPGLLAAFHARHPNVALRVRQGNSRDVLAALRSGVCEVGLVEGPPGAVPPGFEVETFREDELVLVVAPTHPLVGRARLTPRDLGGLGVVWREPGSGTREVAESALERAGIEVRTVLELAGTEAVKAAVISGLGAAFVSELRVQREREAGLLVSPPVALPGLRRALRVVKPPSGLRSRALEGLLALLDELGGAPAASQIRETSRRGVRHPGRPTVGD